MKLQTYSIFFIFVNYFLLNCAWKCWEADVVDTFNFCSLLFTPSNGSKVRGEWQDKTAMSGSCLFNSSTNDDVTTLVTMINKYKLFFFARSKHSNLISSWLSQVYNVISVTWSMWPFQIHTTFSLPTALWHLNTMNALYWAWQHLKCILSVCL